MGDLHLFLFEDKSNTLKFTIEKLQQKYPNLLTGLNTANLTEAFLQRVFSIGFDSKVFISNRSMDHNLRQILTIRPKLSPQLESVLPDGRSFMLQGAVDLGRPNPSFTIHKLFEVPDTDGRFYEQEVDAVVRLIRQGDYGERQNSIFTTEFVSELPKISQVTEERLGDWNDYLNWRDAICQSRLEGLRFVDSQIVEASTRGEEAEFELQLSVICENKNAWNRYRRKYLQSMPMALLSLEASTDELEFTIDKNKNEREIRLGEYKNARLIDSPLNFELSQEIDIPWENPVFATIQFQIENEDQLSILRASTAETIEAKAEEIIRRNYLEQGFIVPSIVGDIALINRQRRAIRNLNSEENEAPFLTSWLFDIDKANLPAEEIEITHWNRTDLNPKQKKAVEGMLNAPDVYLLQGPPGTGKTTVIAEAIYQMVIRGQKVLLSSQANLAVDNVFERLASTPEIRMVRLGKDRKISEEGKQFVEKNVLHTFYKSVGNKVEERFTGRWTKQDEERNTWQQFNQENQFITHDLVKKNDSVSQLRNSLNHLKDEKNRLINRNNEIRSQNEENRQQRHYYSLFKKWLATGEDQEFRIPFPVAQKTWNEFLAPSKQAEVNGITIFQHTDVDWNEQQLLSFLQSIRLNVLRIRQLIDAIPTIQQDLNRLKNGTSLSTEAQLELETIDVRLNEIQTLLMGDDALSYLAEFKQLNSRKLELQRSSQSAFDKIYDRVYMAHSNLTVKEQLERYKQQQLIPQQIKLLQQLSQLAKSYQMAMPNIIEGLIQITVSQENSLVDQLIEERPLREMEAKIQHQAVEINQLEENLNDLKHRQQKIFMQVQNKLEQKFRPDQLSEIISSQISSIEAMQHKEASLKADLWPLLEEWNARLNSKKQAKNDHEHYIETYIASCNVVGVSCTEHPKVLEKADHTSFEVAIVDEVSKATPPELLIPMVRARKTVLVGDHRQLPPVFTEHEKQYKDHLVSVQEEGEVLLTEANFGRFEKMVTSSLFKEYFEKADSSIKSSLLVQYRMHPQIMEMINHFYEHRLESGIDEPDKIRAHHISIPSTRGLSFVSPQKHAYWIDTTTDPTGELYYETQEGTSKINLLEQELIIEFLRKLDASLVDQTEVKDVGIISFYGKQIRDLRRRCRKENFKHIKCDINTVDRFQGKEKSIVIVSMVRHVRMKNQHKRPDSHIASFQRINVAFSRAKELLVVFGAKSFYEDWPIMLPKMDKSGEDIYPVYGAILNGVQQTGGLFMSSDIIASQNYKAEEETANDHHEQMALSQN